MTADAVGKRPAIALLGAGESALDWMRAFRAEDGDVSRIPAPGDDDFAEILAGDTDAIAFLDARDPAPVKRAILARKHVLLAGDNLPGSRDLLLMDDLARARSLTFMVDVAGLADPALEHLRCLAPPDHPVRRPHLIRCTVDDPSRDLDALLLDALSRVIAIAGTLPHRVSAITCDRSGGSSTSSGEASAPPRATSHDGTSSRARKPQSRHPERSEGSCTDTGAPGIHRGPPSRTSASGASAPPGSRSSENAAFATLSFTTATLVFEDGLIARIDVASSALVPRDILTVVSPGRSYTIDALDPTGPLRITTALRGPHGPRIREHLPNIADAIQSHPVRVARCFLDAVAGGAAHANARDAARALLVRETARVSIDAAGDFIRLPAAHPLVARPRPALHVIKGGGHTTDAVARPRLRLVQGGRPARDLPIDDPPRSA